VTELWNARSYSSREFRVGKLIRIVVPTPGSALCREAPLVSFDDLVRNVEPQTISKISLRAVERLEQVAESLLAHPAPVVPNNNLDGIGA